MADLYRASVMHVTADNQIQLNHLGEAPKDHFSLALPGGVDLFFDGYGEQSEANLLGFLDQMHAIRNTLLQDIDDRQPIKRG